MTRRCVGQNYTGSNTPSINTTGCLTGDGTIGTPVDLTLAPGGNLVCTASGLNVSGITSTVSVTGCIEGDGSTGSPLNTRLDVSGGLVCTASGLAAQLNTSGCLTGQGTIAAPLFIQLDPSGGITCGASGLTLDGTGCPFAVSYETGHSPSGTPTAPVDPTPDAVENTIQMEVYDDCLNFFVYDGTNWSLDKKYCAEKREYTADNTGGGLGGFTDPLAPTALEILVWYAANNVSGPKAGDTVLYQSPDTNCVYRYLITDDGASLSAVLLEGPNRKRGQDTITATAVDFDAECFDNKYYVLGSDISPTFTATVPGKYHWVVEMGGTGTQTVTFPGNVIFSGATPQPNVGVGTVTVFEFYFDGTNFLSD